MRGTPVLVDSLGGGLNSAAAPYEVGQAEARDLLNVIGTRRGSVKKRNGSVTFNGAGLADLHGLFASQSKGLFVASGAGKIQKVTTGGVVTDLKTGLNATARWEFAESAVSGGQGPIFGMNGVDTPQQWDGVAGATSDWTAATGAVPNGKALTVAGNRLWVITDDSLYWSNIGDFRDWPPENVERFDPNEGGVLTGVGTVGPYVLVFKRDKAWVVTDLDVGANRPLGKGVGCVAHRSIQETIHGTLFLARDGVYATDGSSVNKLTDKVQPTVEAALPAEISHAAGFYFDHHYYLSFARSAGDPDRTLDFDMDRQSFWLHSGVCGHQWAQLDVGAGMELFCAGPAAMLRCFVDGQTTDSGALFLGFWASAFLHFGQPGLRKRFREVRFDGAGLIDFYYTPDFTAGDVYAKTADLRGDPGLFGVDDGSLWGVDDGSVYGGTATVSQAKAPSLGVARSLSMKFGNQTADPFEVDSFTVAMQWRRD